MKKTCSALLGSSLRPRMNHDVKKTKFEEQSLPGSQFGRSGWPQRIGTQLCFRRFLLDLKVRTSFVGVKYGYPVR